MRMASAAETDGLSMPTLPPRPPAMHRRFSLDRVLKAIYVRMPLDWDARLRLKARVFTRLAPLIKGTPAYRRWRDAEREAARQAAFEQSQRTLKMPTASASPARRALAGSHAHKLILVVHDANAHGAQYLALNLLRELTEELAVNVKVILLGPGPLTSAFESLAVVHALDADRPEQLAALARTLHAEGFVSALANSLVAGKIARGLAASGIRVVTLVHEMPGIIRDYGLAPVVADVVAHSAAIVVPSEAVARGLREFAATDRLDALCVTLPQGLFVRSRHLGGWQRAQAAVRLRDRLGLHTDAKIVLAVGYADRRKGLDWFVSALSLSIARDRGVHAVWVGHHDPAEMASARAAIDAAGLADHFHFVGPDFDTDDYYAGADLFALTSREDPFPSVLLEALSVGTPAIAFSGTGGGADLIDRLGGKTVAAGDVVAYAAAVDALLADEAARSALAQRGVDAVTQDFSGRQYAISLLSLAGIALPRVSVIVPNFNYASYLRERLASISAQTLPVFEIIVLDDASTDGSQSSLAQLRPHVRPIPSLYFAATNSGSVFVQWKNGVEKARGDWIWIAEADDLATPEFLESLVLPMSRDPHLVMAYCQSRPIDGNGELSAPDYRAWTDDLSRERWLSSYRSSGREEVVMALGVKNTIPNVSAVVFRKDALLDALRAHLEEIVSFTSAGDWVTYLRVLEHGSILFEPTPANLHRRHVSSVVATQNPLAHAQEVRRAQSLARSIYGIDASGAAAAELYVSGLEEEAKMKAVQNKGAAG